MRLVWKIVLIIAVIVAIVFLARGMNSNVPPAKENPNTNNEELVYTPEAGLPEAVEAKRKAIWDAAENRSYEELAALADPSISYTFGGAYESGFVEYLRQYDERDQNVDLFMRIQELLAQPYYKQANIYAWPAVFGKSALDWTSEDIEMVKKIATDAEIEGYRGYGSYIGHRIGIRDDGTWIFFIAGD